MEQGARNAEHKCMKHRRRVQTRSTNTWSIYAEHKRVDHGELKYYSYTMDFELKYYRNINWNIIAIELLLLAIELLAIELKYYSYYSY